MTQPEEIVERLLFAKAKEYTDLDLYFPNDVRKPPEDGSSYVEVTHFRNGSERQAMDDADGEDMNYGMLQLCVYVKKGVGTSEARKRAADLVTLFWTPARLRLQDGAVSVKVQKKPVLGTGLSLDTAYAVPVSVYYEVSL